jgi:hypothetical protein
MVYLKGGQEAFKIQDLQYPPKKTHFFKLVAELYQFLGGS